MRVTSLIPVFRNKIHGSPAIVSRSCFNGALCLSRQSSKICEQNHMLLQLQPLAFRTYATSAQRDPKSSGSKAVAPAAQSSGSVSVSLGEKVKENAKTGIYGGVILLGIAVTGGMGFVIFRELFSSDSPQNIYSASFKLCKLNSEVQDALGTPLKCYGEQNSRGRRRHVAHQEFLQPDGNKILRMKYYIEGQFRRGTVNLEKKTNSRGKYEYTYLIVDVDGYPPTRIEVNARLMD